MLVGRSLWYRRVWPCLLLMAVVGSGCVDIVGGGGECTVNGDCISSYGPGWVCQQNGLIRAGRCLSPPKDACFSVNDCPAGFRCANNTCLKESACNCRVDSDCSSGQRCRECQCFKDPSGTCKTDADCAFLGPSFGCNASGSCVTKPTKCNVDQDCKAPKKCENNICVMSSSGCQSDADCGVGEACVSGQCSPVAGECQSSADCPKEKPLCNSAKGSCVVCLVNLDCEVDRECTADGNCIKRQACNCSRDRDCNQNQRCVSCRCVERPGPKTVQEGEVCDEEGTTGTDLRKCVNGFRCVRFSNLGGGARCARDCAFGDPVGCAHSDKQSCVMYGASKGICAFKGCKNNQECPLKGYSCTRYVGGSVCLPTLATGKVPFGGVCQSKDLADNCSRSEASGGHPDAVCLQAGNKVENGTGYCSIECSSSQNCPTWTGPGGKKIVGLCAPLSGTGQRFCVFSCNVSKPECPDGLKCLSSPGEEMGICFAQ